MRPIWPAPRRQDRKMHPKPPVLEIRHAAAERVRLRPAKEMEPAALKALGDRIGGLPGLRRVLVRPATGSVIVEFGGPAEALFKSITAAGIGQVRLPDSPPPIGQIARMGMLKADMSLKQRTGNVLDLNAATALLLLSAAVFQAARGQVAGPASSLVMAAWSLLDRGNGK